MAMFFIRINSYPATYADVYAMIASLYLSMATERDTVAGSEEILGEIPPIEEEQ